MTNYDHIVGHTNLHNMMVVNTTSSSLCHIVESLLHLLEVIDCLPLPVSCINVTCGSSSFVICIIGGMHKMMLSPCITLRLIKWNH